MWFGLLNPWKYFVQLLWIELQILLHVTIYALFFSCRLKSAAKKNIIKIAGQKHRRIKDDNSWSNLIRRWDPFCYGVLTLKRCNFFIKWRVTSNVMKGHIRWPFFINPLMFDIFCLKSNLFKTWDEYKH